jgi:hypothetical protein
MCHTPLLIHIRLHDLAFPDLTVTPNPVQDHVIQDLNIRDIEDTVLR